jgi:hypothetical protein
MKGPGLVLLFLLISVIGCLHAIIWQLEVTGVSPQEITADMHVTNNGTTAVTWNFGYPDWIHLFLDGNGGVFGSLPVVCPVTIPAGTTITEPLSFSQFSYYPVHLIPDGEHIVQAYIRNVEGGPEWIPVGNIVTVNVIDPNPPLTYELTVTDVSIFSISATVQITNNSDQAINWSFDEVMWLDLYVDGQNDMEGDIEVPTNVSIAAGETISKDIYYSVLTLYPIPLPLTVGMHTVQAFRQRVSPDEPEWVAVSSIENVEVFPLEGLLEYVLDITSVSNQAVTADLHITNNTNNDINWEYGDTGWVDLFLNDLNDDCAVLPVVININIPVGATLTESLTYAPLGGIPFGWQVVQAKQKKFYGDVLVWEAVTYPIEVEIPGTGIDSNELPLPMTISAYPNPFSNQLSLSLKSRTFGKADIEIFNIKGQLIKSFSSITKNGENLLNWDGKDTQGNNAPAGMYLINVNDGKTKQILKCLKME